ncbi:MAG: polymorphic toxin-type HINT domain-containing protein [Planctomycetia bacterium]|nr:polymorphic toxin-type HINT domain-containing protein [Planctomycetia bacterium]
MDRVLTAAILTCFSLGAWFWTNSPNTNAAVSKNHGVTQGTHLTQQDLNSPASTEHRDTNSATKPATRYITKNIEDIREGDFVLARDEYGSALGYRKVVEVYRRTTYHLRHLTFESEDGTQQTVETTDEHPFWLATQERWRNAGDLTVGDHVISPDGHFQILTITHRTEHPLGIPVFNFQVEKSHTYFVATKSGDKPIFVHNACMSPDQIALKELTHEASNGGRKALDAKTANTLLDWADEFSYPGWRASANDLATQGNHWVTGLPHIHIPGIGSHGIPVLPGVIPR